MADQHLGSSRDDRDPGGPGQSNDGLTYREGHLSYEDEVSCAGDRVAMGSFIKKG